MHASIVVDSTTRSTDWVVLAMALPRGDNENRSFDVSAPRYCYDMMIRLTRSKSLCFSCSRRRYTASHLRTNAIWTVMCLLPSTLHIALPSRSAAIASLERASFVVKIHSVAPLFRRELRTFRRYPTSLRSPSWAYSMYQLEPAVCTLLGEFSNISQTQRTTSPSFTTLRSRMLWRYDDCNVQPVLIPHHACR